MSNITGVRKNKSFNYRQSTLYSSLKNDRRLTLAVLLAYMLAFLCMSFFNQEQLLSLGGVILLYILVCLTATSLMHIIGRRIIFVMLFFLAACLFAVRSISASSASFSLVIFVCFSISLISYVAYFIMKPLEGKGVLRRLILGCALSSVLCSTILFSFAVALFSKSSATYPASWMAVFLCVAYLTCAGIAFWGIARLNAASDPWLFSYVLRSGSIKDPMPIAQSPTREIYLLNALMRPAFSITRIRDVVELGKHACHVHSQIEYRIPAALIQREGSGQLGSKIRLTLPVVFQAKCEFTRNLTVATYGGSRNYRLYRLSDGELSNLLCMAFKQMIKMNNWVDIGKDEIRSLIEGALEYHVDETDFQFDARLRSLMVSAGLNSTQCEKSVQNNKGDCQFLLEKFVIEFFYALRYIKPICYVIEMDGESNIYSNITIEVERDVSFVPVRQMSINLLHRIALFLKRCLTKKRLHYYFGLGNADCCNSYHVSFRCPDDFYLSEVRIAQARNPVDFFICEDIRICSRYDQVWSQAYIKSGRGFSCAALEMKYERRNHKPVAALVATSFISLLMALALYSGVFSGDEGADAFLPLGVLSVSALITIWQAMEEYRAEEWLWLCIGAVAVSSSILAVITLFRGVIQPLMGSVWELVWRFCLTIHFVSGEVSALVLFEKLKLHGAIMDRVPRLRQVPASDPSSFYRYNFNELLSIQEARINYAESEFGQCSSRVWSPSLACSLGREGRYEIDIAAYRVLISKKWVDGWLIPMWTSSLNPYRLPSVSFSELARQAIKEQR